MSGLDEKEEERISQTIMKNSVSFCNFDKRMQGNKIVYKCLINKELLTLDNDGFHNLFNSPCNHASFVYNLKLIQCTKARVLCTIPISQYHDKI